MLKYGFLLVLCLTAFWMWRRATPRGRQSIGVLLLVLLAVTFYLLVVRPLLDPGG